MPTHGRRHIHRRGEAAPHFPPRPPGEVRLQHGPERPALLRPREDQLHAETPRGATVRAAEFGGGVSGDVYRDPLSSQSILIPPYIISALKYLSMVPDFEITPERVCFPLSREIPRFVAVRLPLSVTLLPIVTLIAHDVHCFQPLVCYVQKVLDKMCSLPGTGDA